MWDRAGNPTVNGGTIWNTSNREYLWVVNTNYNASPLDPLSQTVINFATWNLAFLKSMFNINDVLTINYDNPIIAGVDRFDFNTLATPVEKNSEVINSFRLEQNYPNPFNPSTTIKYAIPQAGIVLLKIYDVLGQEVKTLINEYKIAGAYSVDFNAEKLASGIYFYRLQSENFVETKKMILLK